MAKLVTHKFVSAIPDGDDATIVRPSNWNDTHDVSGVAESGTNTDITSMTGITGGISSPNFVQFDTTAAESSVTGKLFWDDGDGVLSNGLKGGNVTLQIGTQEFARVYNDSGTTLTKGQAVYISGAQGNRVAVKLARADVEATSFGTIGLVAETMTNGAEGFIIVSGALYKLDTLGLVAGATVYLSPTTAGALTTTKPQAPQQLVVVGWVERVHATVGSIYVKVDNGYELDELHDVKIVSPTTGQTLVYDQPTGVWNNSNAPTISGGTINGTTIGATTPSSIVGTTITGQTGVLRGTGNNLFLQSGLAGGTSGTVGSGAVAPTSWIFGSTGGTVTYASALSGSGNSIRFAATSQRPFIQQSLSANFVVGITYSVSFNVETVTSGTINVANIFSILNTTATPLYYVDGISVPSSTVLTSNTNVQIVIPVTATSGTSTVRFGIGVNAVATGDVTLSNPQLEIGSVENTYIPTTTTAVYGTPTLSFSGVSTLGLESNGALFLQPAGTGAIQAQATTSTTAGGNVRGANAVDWQTQRSAAGQVASAQLAVIGGGTNNSVTGAIAGVLSGGFSSASSQYAVVAGGAANSAGQYAAGVVAGQGNGALGYFNLIGGGFTNSGTSGTAVTTQATTTVTNGSTAVTLSGSNANIKVGQLIAGTGIPFPTTYVAAISGTSLTLSAAATATGTPTLSFFTPHGVVVGGGNNQATGSYSFIGGGGDAGTAANRNVASGDYSVVVGGRSGTASGFGSFVGGGGFFGIQNTYPNTASGTASVVVGGLRNTAIGEGSFVGSGDNNTANANYSSIAGGNLGTARSIRGNAVFPACQYPISATLGVSQAALVILARQTTDATATALTSDNTAAGTINQVILPNNSAYYFKGSVIANVTGAANGAAWSIEGAIMRGANAASTVLIDTPSVNRVATSAGATAWVVAVTADTTNGGIRVTVTGVASTTIRWVCKLETTEVTF